MCISVKVETGKLMTPDAKLQNVDFSETWVYETLVACQLLTVTTKTVVKFISAYK